MPEKHKVNCGIPLENDIFEYLLKFIFYLSLSSFIRNVTEKPYQ